MEQRSCRLCSLNSQYQLMGLQCNVHRLPYAYDILHSFLFLDYFRISCHYAHDFCRGCISSSDQPVLTWFHLLDYNSIIAGCSHPIMCHFTRHILHPSNRRAERIHYSFAIFHQRNRKEGRIDSPLSDEEPSTDSLDWEANKPEESVPNHIFSLSFRLHLQALALQQPAHFNNPGNSASKSRNSDLFQP